MHGGPVTFDQKGSHHDGSCDHEDIAHTEKRRLLERRDQLDDVDHGKAHEQHDPGCPQDGRGDRMRGRVIEGRGRSSVGALVALSKVSAWTCCLPS